MPTVTLTGIAPSESFGPVTVTTATPLTVAPTAIAPSETIPSPVVTNGQLIKPVAIAPSEVIPQPKVTRGSTTTKAVGTQSTIINSPKVSMTTGGVIGVSHYTVSAGSAGSDSFFVRFRAKGRLNSAPNLSADNFKRGLTKANIVMPTPAIVMGRPVVPLLWLKNDSSITLTTGVSDIRSITPPVPVVTHPSGPAATVNYTWTVEDLADPPGSHGFYNLSTWREHSGGPAWQSSGIYRPRVADKVVYGTDNAYQTYSRAVHFDASNVEHMWLDLGTHSQPFTWVMCGMINYYPYRTYGHYLLDAGRATPQRDTTRDWKINDNLTYRSLLLYQTTSVVMATHTGADAVANGKHIKGPHDEIARPRVFVGVFNGSSSWVGSYDRYHSYGKSGKIDVKTHRYFVMGRRQGNVSDNLASHMTMFEIRFFNSALSSAQRAAQYKQLASKWSFNKYGRGT